MPVVIMHTSPLLWARVLAMLFACVAFSVALHGGLVTYESAGQWSLFSWGFSFIGTALVLLVEMCGLQSRMPVSWKNFPITFACYASLFCLSASIIFPLYFVKGASRGASTDYHIASLVFSCLATIAYLTEVSISKARPGEVAGYMATAPGLLKVCETFVACIIFVFISDNNVTYDENGALKWCMAVYCICFILSAVIIVLCVGECTGCLPFPFARFLSAYASLAVAMYLTATIIWPIYKFDRAHGGYPSRPSSCTTGALCPYDKKMAIAVLTGVNFILYLADLIYSARLVFVTV